MRRRSLCLFRHADATICSSGSITSAQRSSMFNKRLFRARRNSSHFQSIRLLMDSSNSPTVGHIFQGTTTNSSRSFSSLLARMKALRVFGIRSSPCIICSAVDFRKTCSGGDGRGGLGHFTAATALAGLAMAIRSSLVLDCLLQLLGATRPSSLLSALFPMK